MNFPEGTPKETNKALRLAFAKANKLYFKNRLPKNTLVLYAPLRGLLGVCYERKQGGPRIVINEKYRHSWTITIGTLLHEMVHLEGYWGHGWRFNRRMLRIAKLGALNGLW